MGGPCRLDPVAEPLWCVGWTQGLAQDQPFLSAAFRLSAFPLWVFLLAPARIQGTQGVGTYGLAGREQHVDTTGPTSVLKVLHQL